MKEIDPSPLPYGVTLMDRAPCGCAWPVNDGSPFLFCNQRRVGGKSYCAEHLGKMTTKVIVGQTKAEWVADQQERRRTAKWGLLPA